MSKHAFAKELMVRLGGVYPKYGAIDRDYYGPEHDGFQDTFTMSAYTNLEWGRFEPVHEIIDEYFTDMVDSPKNPCSLFNVTQGRALGMAESPEALNA
jgi:hypothetical protein